jgi:hypothetical protein
MKDRRASLGFAMRPLLSSVRLSKRFVRSAMPMSLGQMTKHCRVRDRCHHSSGDQVRAFDLQKTTDVGPNGGASFSYRGASIHADYGCERYELVLAGLPASRAKGMGSMPTILWVVDTWLDTRAATLKRP